jgi:hypothetical protein
MDTPLYLKHNDFSFYVITTNLFLCENSKGDIGMPGDIQIYYPSMNQNATMKVTI